ncbi:MAG: YceI family protein [Bacteroidia bacterium]
MKKILAVIAIVLTTSTVYAQNILLATGGKMSFFSETPLENIDATSQSATSVITTTTNAIQFTIPVRTFKFKKALMEEHFNEKYVESEKFPKSTFKGTINEAINWSRDTVANITATGVMDLHGVNKMITESGKLTIKNGVVTIDFVFNVALKDYNIEVPKVVTQSVAEVIKITGSFTYKPYIKKQ